MPSSGKIQWHQNPQKQGEVTTNLTVTAKQDGSVHLETPQGLSGDYKSPSEASRELTSMIEQGHQFAKTSDQ